MAEQPLFLPGEPPDFSLLPVPPTGSGGTGTTGDGRTGLPERPRSPPSVPGQSPGFPQEAVLLPSPPVPLPGAPAALPEHPGVSAVPTGSLDALSLINLQCQLLAGGTGSDNGTSTGPDTGTGSGRRRKQARPRRGADPRDPSFRGVTLRMRLELPRGDTGDCRLLIAARAHRIPTRSSGSSNEDGPVPKGRKRCTSCKTHRTPLWRTAEDGTVLCNACGIRYRKYGVRCRRCWNIPGKNGTPQGPRCPQCPLRVAGAGGDSEDATAAG